VGQLAGGIAHDFNNLLATIILYADMVLETQDLSPRTERALETILRESHRAADLVQQVLDFSRRAMMETEACSLVAVVRETLSLLQRTIPEHVRLATEMTPLPCIVQADRTRIQQVLMNLALNARDAMPEGGELRIAVQRVTVAPGDEPLLPDMAPGAWACLTVSDTGLGMTEKVQEHLFEPFFTTKEEGKGTGLGLAQVYGIVKQHQGFIDADSALGEGTTFTIFLPLLEDRDEEDAAVTEAPPLRGHGETILVVEDAERLRRAVKAGLESFGYRVITAANGLAALEARSRHEVDLVLTDVVMPEMGGEALLRSLRTDDPHLKVIAMTGHVVETDVKGLRAAGFADAISKPFSIKDLARVVRNVLDE
jgi:CheY-like chemotaxis protein